MHFSPKGLVFSKISKTADIKLLKSDRFKTEEFSNYIILKESDSCLNSFKFIYCFHHHQPARSFSSSHHFFFKEDNAVIVELAKVRA